MKSNPHQVICEEIYVVISCMTISFCVCTDNTYIISKELCWSLRMSTFRFVDVSTCRRFGLSTFWFVDVSACRRFGLSTFWFVDVSVCRRFGLSTFRFVDVSVCRRFGCRRFGLSTFWLSTFRCVDVLTSNRLCVRLSCVCPCNNSLRIQARITKFGAYV